MANWTKQRPEGVSTRRKWNTEDRTSLNNLKYHIAAEGCSEVQYDLAKQLLEKTIGQNESTTSKEQAVHWLLCAAQQGHDKAIVLLRQCLEEGCGITSDNETQVRNCLSMTPGERAARQAARELFACLSNGNEHITPKQLERKMREIYKLQKRRRRHGSLSEDDEEEINESQRNNLKDMPSIGNGHVYSGYGRSRRTIDKNNRNAGEGDERQAVITEENLVSAAVNYAAGRLPTVNDALILSVPDPASLDHVPCFYRMFFHPVIFCTLLYHRLVNAVSSIPATMAPGVHLFIALVIYLLSSIENVIFYLPIVFYYIFLAVMIWSTCKMLKTKHDFIDFRIWSGLFLRYGNHSVEADISENRFLKNNLKPYLYFFGAFVGNLLVSPYTVPEWLPHSEITIISGVFVFISLLVFMYASARRIPDWVVLISFAINVLAKYPYEMDEVVTTDWRFIDLKVPTFCSFVIGNGIEFCLNCRTALYLLIPGFLLQLAKRANWHGTYTHLIPHCVTLSWLQLCISTSKSATMFGVVRATLGLAGILLFLPLFGLVSILIPVFVAIDWMGFTDSGIRLGSTIVATLLTILGSCLLAVNRTTQKYITILQVIVGVTAACILTFPYMANLKDSSRFVNVPVVKHTSTVDCVTNEYEMPHTPDFLAWQRFYLLCGQPALENQNQVKAQLRCSHFNGMNVVWEGLVSHVHIVRSSNIRAELIAKYLPNWVANVIRCIYGDRISDELKCDLEENALCSEMQRILKSNYMEGKCSLNKWNQYDYEIRVKMSSGLLSKGADIVLTASHEFGNFTHGLAVGDRVQFYGNLQNSRVLPNGDREDFILGSTQTRVKLIAIKCIHCHNNAITFTSVERKSLLNGRLRDLMRGIKYLLNVLLNPLITFK